MSELVLRQPCEHGETQFHTIDGSHAPCSGRVEVVLDPDGVLRVDRVDIGFPPVQVTVADVLAALEEKEYA